MKITAQAITKRDEWNTLLASLPYAHILQTWEWGDFKRDTVAWRPERLALYADGVRVGAASMLTRKVGPLTVMYCPKGPVIDYGDIELTSAVLDYLQDLAKSRRALWLKIDADVIIATGVPDEADDSAQPDGQALMQTLKARGWCFSGEQVQFRNTMTLDLKQDEEALLAGMSQNTRRKIRTAEKKGVSIRAATVTDLPILYALYQATGQRDGFLTRPPAYYEKAWRDFMQAGLAHALIADAEGVPIAHVILFHFGRICWYFYGASSNEERQRMPNYLLQWEAMRWAKAQGYTQYDMWGAPDVFDESDSMWGVYEFKRGFRGDVVRHMGAWDYAPNPLLYRLYADWWPRIRNLIRRLK